jgi:hypothetical protein
MDLVQAVKKHVDQYFGGVKALGTYVLGTQLAHARVAQQNHEEAHGGENSPLAPFSYSHVESRLWRWADSPVDRCVEAKVADFASLGEADRNSMRDSLTMDDFYTLLTFVRRYALATLRIGDTNKIETAFTAVAMIEFTRVDWRDLMLANWLIRYAGQRLGVPLANLVGRTMQLAEPQTAKAMLEDMTVQIDLARSCGYREVRTSEGVSLFETGYQRFSPKADLIEFAFEAAVALEGNGYEIGSVRVASDLPLTWLDSQDGSAIADMVRKCLGCVCIQGMPRADPEPLSSGQFLLVFLAEAASDSDAQDIAVAAEISSDSLSTQISLASGPLCAVIIQTSCMADTPPLEDVHSLGRLRSTFEQLLV